jgi:hypothetical protein
VFGVSTKKPTYETAEPEQPTVAIDVPDRLEDREGVPVDEFPEGRAVSGRRPHRFERPRAVEERDD